MKILLFGGDGQLGRQLRRSLAALGDVVAVPRTGARQCGDLSDPDGIAATVSAAHADVVVNAAAWTDVDAAEHDPVGARAINATAVDALARACGRAGNWLVHFSTDYVFDGSGERPWREDDEPRPICAYGLSKLEGERAATAGTARHLVLRTGWLFEPGHRNFVTSVLHAAASSETLEVVDDQWGGPTRAALVADTVAGVLAALRQRTRPELLAGLYHVSAAGFATRLQCAALAIDAARAAGVPLRLRADGLRGVSTARAPRPAARPLNCRLDTAKLRQTFNLPLPAWQDGVRDAVTRMDATAPGGAA